MRLATHIDEPTRAPHTVVFGVCAKWRIGSGYKNFRFSTQKSNLLLPVKHPTLKNFHKNSLTTF